MAPDPRRERKAQETEVGKVAVFLLVILILLLFLFLRLTTRTWIPLLLRLSVSVRVCGRKSCQYAPYRVGVTFFSTSIMADERLVDASIRCHVAGKERSGLYKSLGWSGSVSAFSLTRLSIEAIESQTWLERQVWWRLSNCRALRTYSSIY